MANAFIFPINDDFEQNDGAMTNYVGADRATPVVPRHHYDIRAFHVMDETLTYSQTDHDFWNGYAYNLNVGDDRSLGTLGGTETWDTGGGSVTVGKDAAYRYSNTIRILIPSTTSDGTYGEAVYGTSPYGSSTIIVGSAFPDDIITDFDDPTRTYFIELVLRNFPAQSASPHFDLSNSYIDFSSTTNFTAATTDSVALSASLNDVSSGGDTFLRFPRSLFHNVTLSNLQAVRFRLKALGGTALFIAQALRLVDDQYTWQQIDIDTKRGQLARSVPRSGGTESSSVYGDIYFQYEQPRDVSYITQFNAGHNPTGADNVLRHFFRTQANGDRIEIKLTSRDTQSRLFIIQTLNGVTTTIASTNTNTNVLSQESTYFLVSELVDEQVRASIYQRNGYGPGTLVYTTDWQTVGLTSRGLIGYSFEPYMYDFTIQYMAPQTTSFASFQTTAFNSIKLVRGATLYPVNSTPVNLTTGIDAEAWGDATISTDPNGDLNIVRTGTLTQGGIRYADPIFLGDTSQMTLGGYLWTTLVQGTYRAALVDEVDEVLWLGNMEVILPNQWNHFEFNISPGLQPKNAYLHIQQSGAYSGSFKLRDIEFNYNTISWQITPDNGTTWIPFLNAINDEFTGVAFQTDTTSMKIRATATTDVGWISGYQLVPQYVY